MLDGQVHQTFIDRSGERRIREVEFSNHLVVQVLYVYSCHMVLRPTSPQERNRWRPVLRTAEEDLTSGDACRLRTSLASCPCPAIRIPSTRALICRRTSQPARGGTSNREFAAAAMMSLHKARKATALCVPHDMYEFVLSKNIDHHLVAGIRVSSPWATPRNLAERHSLFEVAGHRFADALWLDEFDEPSYGHRSRPSASSLHDNAGTRLNHRYRNDRSIIL
jgi:hypothetical protein